MAHRHRLESKVLMCVSVLRDEGHLDPNAVKFKKKKKKPEIQDARNKN